MIQDFIVIEQLNLFVIFVELNILISGKNEQWEKLNELSNQIDRQKNDYIKWFADDARHWNHKGITDEQRVKIFQNTWDIVDNFLEYIKNEK